MPSQRKFYESRFVLVVLSEEPIPGDVDLDQLQHGVTDGEWCGQLELEKQRVVDGPEMASLLKAQGSDPGFFELDADGEDDEGVGPVDGDFEDPDEDDEDDEDDLDVDDDRDEEDLDDTKDEKP